METEMEIGQTGDLPVLSKGRVMRGTIAREEVGGFFYDAAEIARLRETTEPEVMRQLLANLVETHRAAGHTVTDKEVLAVRSHYGI